MMIGGVERQKTTTSGAICLGMGGVRRLRCKTGGRWMAHSKASSLDRVACLKKRGH